MKTTVDLPDDLLLQAKEVALKRRTTLKNLLTEGLRHSIQSTSTVNTEHPLDGILSAGYGKWKGCDADAYVNELRDNWE
jgi:hypothetical protein